MRCLDIARSGIRSGTWGQRRALRAGSRRSMMEPPRATAALPEHVMDAVGRLRRSHGALRDRRRRESPPGKAAETLRKEGYDGDVTIVAAEPHPPYQRPPLSKGYLAGKEGLDAAILHPAVVVRRARHRAAHVRRGRPRLDPARAPTRDRRRAISRTTPCCSRRARRRARSRSRGTTSTGVHTLRRLDDSDALAARAARRRQAARADRLGVDRHGGRRDGADARQRGDDPRARSACRWRSRSARGWVRCSVACTPRTAWICAPSVQVERIVGRERAEGVVVDGETVPADLVLIGVGAVPNTALAEGAGIALEQRHPHRCVAADRARPTSTRPATWPTRTTRSSSGICAASTGTTRARRGPSPLGS